MLYISIPSAIILIHKLKLFKGTELRLNMISTVLAYLVITLGVYYFMIEKKFSMKDMAILGAFTYGIYEFTNKALFDKWYVENCCFRRFMGWCFIFSNSLFLSSNRLKTTPFWRIIGRHF